MRGPVTPTASRLARLAPALALVMIAAWSTWRVVGAGAGVPDDAAWGAAAARVRAQHQPGELIVFAPGWVEPVGYLHLGDLVPVEMAARLDAARYPVIWELSIRGARAPATVAVAIAGAKSVTTVRAAWTNRRTVTPPISTVASARRPRVAGARAPRIDSSQITG